MEINIPPILQDTPDWQFISKQIEQSINQPFFIDKTSSVSGGCINSAYLLQGNNHSYFIKLNNHDRLTMFEAEFYGLSEIAQAKTIKVPTPILFGTTESHAFLVLEKLLFSSRNSLSDQQLAQQLASLHKIRQPFFGWHQNNTIGSTEQINTQSDDWMTFWKQNRLGFQLSLAERNGYSGKLISSGEKLLQSLDQFFYDHYPHPSLLHGDLWSGNVAASEAGEPIIFDPACYYGDRETDIAMTELFGGFSPSFYQAYNEVYPLANGYSTRKILYNLYHILNHLNLFGAGYLQQALSMTNKLLAEIY